MMCRDLVEECCVEDLSLEFGGRPSQLFSAA